jgi:putative ABC transport system permease protein
VPTATGTSTLRRQYRQPLLLVLAVVTLILMIAGAIISNLLLTRATARRHEMSVRLALGASRWRLRRQLLVESVLLAAMGAGLGVAVASSASRALVAQLSTSVTPAFLDLSFDWRVMAFATAMTLGTAALFGGAAAFGATRITPIEAFTAGWSRSQGVVRGKAGRGVRTLIVFQTALSLVLLLVAGLFVRTLDQLANVPVGIDAAPVLMVHMGPSQRPVNPTDRLPSYQRVVGALSVLPGVAQAAGSVATPIVGGIDEMLIQVSGAPPLSGRGRISLVNFVTPGWFAVYGVPIRAGRDIDDRDTKSAPSVVVVNEAFVRRFLSARSALGATVVITAHRLHHWHPRPPPRSWRSIAI